MPDAASREARAIAARRRRGRAGRVACAAPTACHDARRSAAEPDLLEPRPRPPEARRHRQARPPDLHRPGEPVVRSLLRHVSRAPTASLATARATSTSASRTRSWRHCSPPYQSRRRRRTIGGPARRRRRRRRRQRRQDGRLHPRRCPTWPGQVLDRSHAWPRCATVLGPDGQPDVMSYARRRETIPNYWTYARQFVLQDRMFAPTDSWTLPAHLFLVSGWSAVCPDPEDVQTCRSDIDLKDAGRGVAATARTRSTAWTDITRLLDDARRLVGRTTSATAPAGTRRASPGTAAPYTASDAQRRCPGFVASRAHRPRGQHPGLGRRT